MAYKKQRQELMPGSLNLLPPRDTIKSGDCLALKGWRPEAVGQLKSRPGAGYFRTLVGSSGVAHTLDAAVTAVGWRPYAGIGTELYEVGMSVLVDNGYDGHPLGFTSYQDWAWVMNRNRQVKHDGTNLFAWTTAPATGSSAAAAAAAGTLAAGDYEYYVTLDTAAYHESNPDTMIPVTVAAGDEVTVTLGAHADPQATGWHVYRLSPALSLIYRVNDTVIPIGTGTYVDTGGTGQSDAELQDRNLVLEQDHDAAPATRGLAREVYNNRILAFSTAANPNRIFWTPSNKPWYFPGSAGGLGGYWLDAGNQQEEVVGIVSRPGYLIIFKENTIWRHIGDLGAGILELVVPDLGLVGPKALAPTGGGIYFQGREGIYFYSGDSKPKKVSPQLDPLFRLETVEIASGITHQPVSDTADAYGLTGKERSALCLRNDRLYYAYASGTGTAPDKLLVYAGGRWMEHGGAYHSLYCEGQKGDLIGIKNGGVDALEMGIDDAGVIIQVAYHSRYEDQEAPDLEKRYAELVIEHNLHDASTTGLPVKVYRNNGRTTADEFLLGVVPPSTVWTRTTIPIVDDSEESVVGWNLAVRIDGSVYQIAEIFKIFLYYYLLPRKRLTFDSGEIDHGTEHVKALDEVELDIENPDGPVTLEIWSDSPGGVIPAGARTTIEIAATLQHQKIPVPIDPVVEGKLLRYTLTSEKEFRLYGFRARLCPIGVFLDGTRGEEWTTREVSIGV